MKYKTYMVTGGAGFIGSNFVRYILNTYADAVVINFDKLTYAGNPENLSDFEGNPRSIFVKGDIGDDRAVDGVFRDHNIDCIVNFAAETHVDRSIGNPRDFITTDMVGVYVLLEASKRFGVKKFIQISTDEVYGSTLEGSFSEMGPLQPSNPYSASKAGGDRLAYSYYVTYGLPVIVTRASNNFGPYQYPEKFISLSLTNLLEGKNIPLYGDGRNVRDWLYVHDHCKAIDFIIRKGKDGETYNIGGGNERENIEVALLMLDILGLNHSRIQRIQDRPGHDRRYSLDSTKLRSLGWEPEAAFEEELRQTVQWYKDNVQWWKKIKSGEFLEYYKDHYGE